MNNLKYFFHVLSGCNCYYFNYLNTVGKIYLQVLLRGFHCSFYIHLQTIKFGLKSPLNVS